MADKDAKPIQSVVIATDQQEPVPVVITPESIAALGDAGVLPAAAPSQAATGTPVHMTVMAPPPPAATVTKGEGTTLAPRTTEADDLVTQGQRDINRLWEKTQSYISLGVTASTILIIGIVVIIAAITGNEITQAMATQINYLVVMTTLILSFYFSRTNHQATGGVGPKPDPSVQSR